MTATPPQYQPPQFQHEQPPQQQVPTAVAPQTDGSFNTAGMIALLIVVIGALSSFVTPFIFRSIMDSGNYSTFSLITLVLNALFVLLPLVFGIIGVLMRQAQRGRWMAIAALGSAACSGIALIGSLLGNWMASLL